MTRAKTGGRRSQFPHAEAWRLRYTEKWTQLRLAEHFGVSRQAIAQGLERYAAELQRQEDIAAGRLGPQSGWPWIIAKEHLSGDRQYRRMLALRHQREGRSLPPREAKEAQELLVFITRADTVITYHRSLGFTFTPRQDEDGDEVFVVRPPEWWEKFGYAA